jgi:hypothetical protein
MIGSNRVFMGICKRETFPCLFLIEKSWGFLGVGFSHDVSGMGNWKEDAFP